ncbi:MAG: type II toxin-antitoxin system RelE/ParE family toxin [Rhizobacter sp.]
MVRVTRRPLAETDILEIWDYIADDSIVQADRWLDSLDQKLALCATQPTI